MSLDFRASSGGIAALGATYERTRSLVFSTGGSALLNAIGRFGGSVVEARVAMNGAASPGRSTSAASVVTALGGLPFRDHSFDNVFLDGMLEWLRAIVPPEALRSEATDRLLRECHRVLRPGGSLIFGVPNDGGLAGLRRRYRSPSGSLFADRAKPRLTSRDAGARWPSTTERYDALLFSCGFEPATWYVPWPRYTSWSVLIQETAPGAAAHFRFPGGSLRNRLLSVAYSLLRRCVARSWLVLDYCGVARKAPAARHSAVAIDRPSVLELVTGPWVGSDAVSERLEIRFGHGAANLLFSAGDRFFKVPLAEDGCERLASEAAALEDLSATHLGPFTVGRVAVSRTSGITYVAYPLLTSRKENGAAESLAKLARACQLLRRNSRDTELKESDSWRRIFEPPSIRLLESAGASPLISHFLDHGYAKKVPVGMVHGDLNAGNVLHAADRMVIIDWDRFERRSPLLLDPISAAFSYTTSHLLYRRPAPAKRLAALRMLLERDRRIPLLVDIERVSGELEWWETIALYVLSAANRQLVRPAIRSAPSHAHEIIRQRVALCLEYRSR